MDSWSSQTSSPDVKFEASPAESFLSMPGEMYPPLFGSMAATTTTTMNPQEIMTPGSFADEKSTEMSLLSGLTGSLPPCSSPVLSATEKKSVKKRKSWGQVLPEPKTNLPPRKRAKTEDEKEQRRVERVLRNRRAAQSSRERKRVEVEALEERNKELETMLLKVQNDNLVLYQELSKFRGNSGVVARNPITFSQELFSSQDGHSRLMERNKSTLGELMMTSQPQTTINPTSLSPALTPVPETEDNETEIANISAAEAALPVKPSADLTQHPAVSVGGSFAGLDGLPATTISGSGSLLSANPLADIHFDAAFDMQAALDADRYVLESRLLSSPNSSTSEYDCVVGDQTFPFSNTDFDINDFLNDETNQPSGGNIANGLAAESALDDPETQASPEDPNLQPHVGASTYGCDDGGIAVGTF